ncbi:tRNA lysidine(34) synthetase TilS [Thermosediminibacter litoriperuensis]|uniref:tRNA(Ile)-lysidine synthase n=1 Tax=Thermosediminibacter litoriperuensis TaxID=291989 RepID=A0A5S5B0T9_9FIRM|nr:tRNA lysidine(34) synthetase TilS [Thermosediminibacter litoriperuensis]TYP58733.1 tRNA(Ile)-lysidine synthase [Thermosediminibacter litoriperuensis]
MDIISVFKDTVNKYRMLQRGDRVLVGVSGGPDSVCLLHLLLRHREEFDISLAVAHLNHCFRGAESDEDEAFVRDLAGKWGLPYYGEKVDVPDYIKKTGLSPEDAARRVRYAFFERVRREIGAGKVALAHNSNDREETILMNIFRGTGLEGLTGIEAVRDHYIRPLIEVERAAIEEYLKREGVPYRIDSTNLQTYYYRNKLRLELIPLIKREYCPHLSASLKRLSEIASADISLLGKLTDEAFARVVRAMPGGVMIDLKKFNELHEALRYRVVRKAVEEILGDLKDFEYRHARMAVEFIAEKPTGSRLNLPRGLTGEKSYEYFYIYRGDPPAAADFYYELPVPGKIQVPEAGAAVTARIIENKGGIAFKANPLMAYLDYGKIKGNLAVRNRRPGDRFIPFGSRFSKKLQDFFVDNKIPAGERDRVPLVVAGDRILWVGGMRIDDRFKVTGDTKKILVLEIQRQNGIQEESTC